MTVFDAEELCSYWSRHPPTHVLVAAFLGVRSNEPANEVRQPQPDRPVPVSFAMAGMPGMAAAVELNVPPPIFDATELMALRPD